MSFYYVSADRFSSHQDLTKNACVTLWCWSGGLHNIIQGSAL